MLWSERIWKWSKVNKIIFVQKEAEDRLGVMILSSYLKSNGYISEIIIDPYKNIKYIKKSNPDFIGISVMTPSVSWSLAACRFLKKHLPNVITILGGSHPTFFPKIIEEQGVDMICIGEGEKSLLYLMESYDGNISSVENTPNFWVKKGGVIIRNQILPLLTQEELSKLPNCDRSHYSIHHGIRNTSHRRILTSRGCPYSCSYCFNSKYKEIYKNLGLMVRQRSVDSVIDELKGLRAIGAGVIDISDDQFLLSTQWTFEFCEKYKKYIKLPFVCNSTPRQINNNIVVALKEAGCRSINFAIESGVEKIRKGIYNKQTSDDDIYNAADALNSNDMPFLTYNMIGLPSETLEDIFQTVNMNQKIRTTYPWCSILQPYPGTKIAARIMQGEGKSFPRFTYSYFQSSVIGDRKRRKLISNAQKLFAYFVKCNIGYVKFTHMVKNQSLLTRFYPISFFWYYGQGIRKRYGYTWPELFKFWLYSK